MLLIMFNDGLEYKAKDYEDAVLKMRESSFNPEASVDEYMEATKRRTEIQTGQRILYSDYESFIKELHRVHIIKQIENL